MKKLVIARGIPGSGKSTYARNLAAYHFEEFIGTSAVICCTDDFHIIDNEYVFQPSQLGAYHLLNQRKAHEMMDHNIELIIIDNTNIKHRDMKPYKDSANQFGYKVKEIIIGRSRLEGDEQVLNDYIDLCTERNTHGVPRETIKKMALGFQR